MEDINKKMQKRYNILDGNIIDSIKEEKEKNKITLRKKKIQNLIMKKRYLDNYSNIDNDLNHINKKSNLNKTTNYNYINDLSSLSIKEELKKRDAVEAILLEKNFKTIFSYINEIYKENNFQIDILKYGLFLLNEKLTRYIKNEDNENKENNDKIIDELIKLNIEDILIKLLNFSMNEIKKNDNDDIILNLAYKILVNYAYLANESQLLFLINVNIIKFHLFFLKFSSEEENIINILKMLYNIFLYTNLDISKLLNYNSNELINILNDYISSAIKKGDKYIIEKILDIYICYLEIIDDNKIENAKYINLNIFNEIYLISLQTIFCKNQTIFSNSLYIIGTMYKILFKTKNIKFLSELILGNNSTKTMISFILDYNYLSAADCIIDLCNIFCYIIKCESYTNDLKIKKQLENFIKKANESNNISGNDIIKVVTILIQQNYTKKIFSKLINVLVALCDSETFYLSIFESNLNPILILINNIDCRIYKIKKKVLIALENLSKKQALTLNIDLIKNQIFNKIKYAIDPNDAYCKDENIIISCLNIIKNLLMTGDILKDLGQKNNNILENFENFGGKEMIERFLNNQNKNIYEKALEIYNEYFNNNKIEL